MKFKDTEGLLFIIAENLKGRLLVSDDENVIVFPNESNNSCYLCFDKQGKIRSFDLTDAVYKNHSLSI